MTPSRFNLGLIGYPLERSLSPQIHQAALRFSGLQGEYRLYPVAPLPEGQEALEHMLKRLRQGSLHGLNVTIPHKQNVLPHLDELAPAARSVGAANTLYVQNGRLVGDNTDIPGFLADLQRQLPGASGKALVLGAGGSARAVVYALLQTGWQVVVAARRLEQAASLLPSPVGGRTRPELAEGVGDDGYLPSVQAVLLEASSLAGVPDVSLVVNATPVGMLPQPGASPWPEDLALPPGAAVYDLIYKPLETRLMRQARQAGHVAFNGLGMLVEQAALSFERWTGVSVNRAAIWEAISS